MEVRLKPETESRLNELASKSGRRTDELVEDGMAGYLNEVADVRNMLDARYDEIKSSRVETVDGESFFETLRRREEDAQIQRPPK
jgi:predicted DNA-binding protein